MRVCLNAVMYGCASIRIIGCSYRNIPVLVLDGPTVLLRIIRAYYIMICKQCTGSAAALYYNRLNDTVGIALLY